jgi:hypothetical protein
MKRGGETEQLVFVVASWPMLFFTHTATHPCPFPRTHTLHRSRAVVPKTICRHRLARMACLIDPRGQENDAPLLRRFFVSPPSTPPQHHRAGAHETSKQTQRGEKAQTLSSAASTGNYHMLCLFTLARTCLCCVCGGVPLCGKGEDI